MDKIAQCNSTVLLLKRLVYEAFFTFESALDLIAHLNERIVTEDIFRKSWKIFSEVTGKKWKFSENIFRKFEKSFSESSEK